MTATFPLLALGLLGRDRPVANALEQGGDRVGGVAVVVILIGLIAWLT